MSEGAKKSLQGKFWIKLLVVSVKISIAVLVFYILIKAGILNIKAVSKLIFTPSTYYLTILGFFLVFIGTFFLSWRLLILANLKGFKLSFNRILFLTSAGNLSGILLPGLVGGDVLKVVYLCSNLEERRIDALSIIIIDRFFGLFSLFFIGSIVVPFLFLSSSFTFSVLNIYILWSAPLIFLITSIFIIGFNLSCKFGLHNIYLNYFPMRIKNLILSLNDILKSPKMVFSCLALSVTNHILVIGTFIIAATLLKDVLPLYNHFILNPLAMSLNVLPLTPGGIGIAEGASYYLFKQAGSLNGANIAITGRCIQYLAIAIFGVIGFSFLKIREKIKIVY